MIETIWGCPKCKRKIKVLYSFDEQGETEHIIDCPYCKYYENFAYGSYFDRNGIITDVPKGVR